MEENQRTAPKRILIVDDEKLVADTLVLIMQKHGYSATACYDGGEAIQCARTFQPDLLITDYELPFVNGMETALEVRASQPACRVVFLSGWPSLSTITDAMWQKKLRYSWICKPINPRELLDCLEKTLDGEA